MNNIVNLSQLIGRVAKATQTDPNTARRFLRAFFAVVEEGLAKGENVHVKGIGTFCRIDDPTVGVPGSVGFAPDTDFAAAVNKPFAMFEAVELADGLTAADLTAADLTEEAPENYENSEIAETAETAENSETAEAAEDSSNPENSETAETAEAAEAAEDSANPENSDNSETAKAAEDSENPKNSETAETADAPEEAVPRSRWWIWAIVGALLAISIGFGAAVLSTPMPDFTDTDEDAVTAGTAPDDTLASETTPVVEETSVTTTIDSITPEPEPQVIQPERAAEPVYDTIRAGYYPAKMARKHYGVSSYWVFIYEANKDKLKNPDQIPDGTRLLIPDKNSLPGANETERKAIAERLSREIKSRYK